MADQLASLQATHTWTVTNLPLEKLALAVVGSIKSNTSLMDLLNVLKPNLLLRVSPNLKA